jgi:hypothetical protein
VDDAGFDVTAPVFGENCKRPKDTLREKRSRELETPEALRAASGPAHSFIRPQSPFLLQTEGHGRPCGGIWERQDNGAPLRGSALTTG